MPAKTSFLEYRPILSTAEKAQLHSLAAQCPYVSFLTNARSYEERSIAYAYVSAKIEGCRYTKRGAAMLLKYGFTEGGQTYKDAVMLVNLKKSFEFVTGNLLPMKTLSKKIYLCARHKGLVDGLLPDFQVGQVRQYPAKIIGCSYRPLKDSDALEAALDKLGSVAETIDDPFELAIYLQTRLAKLHYFSDGNRRLARLIETAVLASNKMLPVFLREESMDEYRRAIVDFYETDDDSAYKALFLREYEHSVLFLQGKTPEQIEAEKRALQSIRER